jgi:hypothetical protein
VAPANCSSLVYVAIDEQFAGATSLRPTIRPEAVRQAKYTLKICQPSSFGARTRFISGDHEKATKKLAATLGIDRYFAETLPEDKANSSFLPRYMLNRTTASRRPNRLLCRGWHQRFDSHEKGATLHLVEWRFYRRHR